MCAWVHVGVWLDEDSSRAVSRLSFPSVLGLSHPSPRTPLSPLSLSFFLSSSLLSSFVACVKTEKQEAGHAVVEYDMRGCTCRTKLA